MLYFIGVERTVDSIRTRHSVCQILSFRFNALPILVKFHQNVLVHKNYEKIFLV